MIECLVCWSFNIKINYCLFFFFNQQSCFSNICSIRRVEVMQLSWSLPSTGRCLVSFHSSLLFSTCPVCSSDPAVTKLGKMLTQSKSWFLCEWSQENHTKDSPSAEGIKGPHEREQPGVQCGKESLRQKQWKGGAGCRRNGITTWDRNSSTSALLGLHFWGKKVTCIMCRNMLQLICSTGSDTTMKKSTSSPTVHDVHIPPSWLHESSQDLGLCILQVCSCWLRPSTGESCWSLCHAHSDTTLSCTVAVPWGHVGCVTLVNDHLASWRSLSRCIGNKRNTSHP